MAWCGRLAVRAGVEWQALTLYSLSPPPADPTCLKVMMLVARRGLKSGTRARFNPARLFAAITLGQLAVQGGEGRGRGLGWVDQAWGRARGLGWVEQA